MSSLDDFFRGSDTTLGVFYPKHCMTAVFRNYAVAGRAAQRLLASGFPTGEVIAATGREVLEFDRRETTVAGLLMSALSRFFKTEQSFADHDLEHARHAAGFLIVRCASDDTKDAAWAIVKVENPLDARYYGVGAIEHLAGDADTD